RTPKPPTIATRFAPLTPAALPPKERSEQAQILPQPCLLRPGFYAILRHTCGKRIPSFHSAEELRQYQLQTGELLPRIFANWGDPAGTIQIDKSTNTPYLLELVIPNCASNHS
ncbi:MAG: hypothetical protein ACUVQG_11075, partial [Thermogutta sp.]